MRLGKRAEAEKCACPLAAKRGLAIKVTQDTNIAASPVTMEGSAGCAVRCLIGPDDGAPSFTMRQFEIAAGGHTPRHAHAYEHEVFVLAGQGAVLEGLVEHPLRPGTAVYVAPQEVHQFRNTGSGPLRFLCLIPHPLRGMSGPCAAACGCD